MTVTISTQVDQKWFDVVENEFAVFVDGVFALPLDPESLTTWHSRLVFPSDYFRKEPFAS